MLHKDKVDQWQSVHTFYKCHFLKMPFPWLLGVSPPCLESDGLHFSRLHQTFSFTNVITTLMTSRTVSVKKNNNNPRTSKMVWMAKGSCWRTYSSQLDHQIIHYRGREPTLWVVLWLPHFPKQLKYHLILKYTRSIFPPIGYSSPHFQLNTKLRKI